MLIDICNQMHIIANLAYFPVTRLDSSSVKIECILAKYKLFTV